MEIISPNGEVILSRKQMKEILGGIEQPPACNCRVGLDCSLYDSATGITYRRDSNAGFGSGSGGYMPCGCNTAYGVYTPSSGQSHCCA